MFIFCCLPKLSKKQVFILRRGRRGALCYFFQGIQPQGPCKKILNELLNELFKKRRFKAVYTV
jgi:hypothetical protein